MTRKDESANLKFPGGENVVKHTPITVNADCDRNLRCHYWWKNRPTTECTNLSGQKNAQHVPSELCVIWLPGEPENPQNWSRVSKLLISIICCMMAFTVAFAASASSMVQYGIAHEFGVSMETSRLMTSMFLCGYTIGPLIWAPLSELIGRKPVLTATFTAYTLCQLGASLKSKFHILLVSRFLAGFFSGSSLANSGAILCDIWSPLYRAKALTIQMSAAFLGPSLGPVYGSFVTESRLGYQWVFRGTMLLSGITCLAVIFLPETYSPVLLVTKAKKLRQTTGNSGYYAAHEQANRSLKGILRSTLFRPIEMLINEPILLLSVIYFSTVYGLQFGLFEIFPIIWQEIRGFDQQQTSLMCLGVGLGSSLAAAVQFYLLRPVVKLVPKWHGHPPCEMNLFGALIAAPLLVGGIFWLGWTGAYSCLPWWVPALATISLGMSFNLMFTSVNCYLVDIYLTHAASALAASAMCRSAVGTVVPLFTHQMYKKLGTQWASTVIGCFVLIISPSSFLFYKYGSRIRARSKFAPNVDLKMKEIIEAEEKHKKTTSATQEIENSPVLC